MLGKVSCTGKWVHLGYKGQKWGDGMCRQVKVRGIRTGFVGITTMDEGECRGKLMRYSGGDT